MYPPTRVWGTGLRGGTKAQPVPQPQLNPWIYPWQSLPVPPLDQLLNSMDHALNS